MYIIGRMNVNASAFSSPPLSLSMIQRHDLWLVSVFQDHPSSAGFTTGFQVVNHAERLSLISINPLSTGQGWVGEVVEGGEALSLAGQKTKKHNTRHCSQ